MTWAIDLTHTAHTSAQTGIQQVCRALYRELCETQHAVPVVFDKYRNSWRRINKSEKINLIHGASIEPGCSRSAKWSWSQKTIGRVLRVSGAGRSGISGISGILCPEFFCPYRMRALFADPFTRDLPKVALLHDTIAVKFPQWCPVNTVGIYPDYLRVLSRFDHVACISKSSESDLKEYWEIHGFTAPQTSVVTLGNLHTMPEIPARRSSGTPLNVLMVGTIEARKNHHNLLDACEMLWMKGLSFSLILAGMANKQTGSEAVRKIRHLQNSGRPVKWYGPVSNKKIQELYANADIFVYPSLYEGYGLPVYEALSYGLPVLTTSKGALADAVEGGGCLSCDGSSSEIAESLELLITNKDKRHQLSMEAGERSIPTIKQCAMQLVEIFRLME